MNTEVGTLKTFFAAINLNDMQAITKYVGPQIVRIESEGVVYLHARVRLKDSTDWVDGRFSDGFVFSDGKIIQYLSFGERTAAPG